MKRRNNRWGVKIKKWQRIERVKYKLNNVKRKRAEEEKEETEWIIMEKKRSKNFRGKWYLRYILIMWWRVEDIEEAAKTQQWLINKR